MTVFKCAGADFSLEELDFEDCTTDSRRVHTCTLSQRCESDPPPLVDFDIYTH